MHDFYIGDEMKKQIENKALFDYAKKYAYDYMDGIFDRNVFPTQDDLRKLEYFCEPLPEISGNELDILKSLHEWGSPNTVAQTAGRYYGFVNGGSLPITLAVKWLADVWDQNSVLNITSPVLSKLEDICEKWLVRLFGLPEDTAAGLVCGSSNAAFCSLAAARNEILNRLGWSVRDKGLFAAPSIKVVLSEHAHATIFKALYLLGFGQENIVKVNADRQGRIIPDAIPTVDEKTILILQAGNVNSGAFDDFERIIKRQHSGWIHIDGAFGLWAAISQDKCHLTKGIERADSWSVDAHKTLNCPYDCGIVLCRSRDSLCSAMQASGSYIQYGTDRDEMLYTSDMSRRARAVELWAAIKYLGRKGIEELVDHLCDMAQYFAEKIEKQNFKVLNEVVFNQVLITCVNPEDNKRVLEKLQQSGDCWCGGTAWEGKPAIRVSICSWATTTKDIDKSVQAFCRAIE